MVLFPNCKINIGLDIVAKRTDGYHDIETVIYPVTGLCDILELIPSDEDVFLSTGLELDCPTQHNICLRAVHLMRESFNIPPVMIRLHKVVPFGAGLGGGSSDAAFTLKGLNELFSLSLPGHTLERIAEGIGSDVPFFIRNQPALATSRGEVLTPISLPLSGKYLFIIKPPIEVSTRAAYDGVKPNTPLQSLSQRLSNDPRTWNELIKNDFEPHIFEAYPMLDRFKRMLYHHGALYAQMSGSGSAVFAIFDGKPPHLNLPPEIFTYQQVIE